MEAPKLFQIHAVTEGDCWMFLPSNNIRTRAPGPLQIAGLLAFAF